MDTDYPMNAYLNYESKDNFRIYSTADGSNEYNGSCLLNDKKMILNFTDNIHNGFVRIDEWEDTGWIATLSDDLTNYFKNKYGDKVNNVKVNYTVFGVKHL